MSEHVEALVIGGGPAGLMAAERLLAAGARVVLCDAMPSVGRKFLMAGKSGLNLTREQPEAAFLSAYGGAGHWLAPALRFGPAEVQDWARNLGQELFVGSSGRVFPVAMKASPLLRAWLARLRDAGLAIRTGWRWQGMDAEGHLFATSKGKQTLASRATLLALGGASWPRLGSDGSWASILKQKGVPIAPFQPANMGFAVPWSRHIAPHFGKPVKPLALIAAGQRHRGEVVITEHGLEGGGLYAVSALVRDGAKLTLDLVPDLPAERVAQRLASRRQGETVARSLAKALSLDPVRLALALEFGRPWPGDAAARAARIKALPVPLGQPQPMERAISTSGGIMSEGFTPELMLHALPGVFAAGEMLDWEAPTGGYLLTGCLATGRLAGDGAAGWLARG